MSEPTNIINYHSDNLTHILHCEQCQEVKMWQLIVLAGLFAVVGLGYLIADYFSKRK
jgi:hypothetical protein